MNWGLRYELRNPPQWRRPWDEVYGTYLEQVAWADSRGFGRVGTSEHHFAPDGYCPSLFVVASATGSVTKNMRIAPGLVLLPFYHPVQVAEDAAVVDVISNGRLDLALGSGYRYFEWDGYGLPLSERGSRMDEGLEVLVKCWEEEEPFDYNGRHFKLKGVCIQPRPVQKPRPKIILGGNSKAAALRAARLADGFWPVPRGPFLDQYREERRRLGKDPGPEAPSIPSDAPKVPLFLGVFRDPEAAWRRIAPHALYECNNYASFKETIPYWDGILYPPTDEAEKLREEGWFAILTPEEAVDLGKRMEAAYGPFAEINQSPLMGGMPYELGWESLELLVNEVMPHFKEADAPAAEDPRIRIGRQ